MDKDKNGKKIIWLIFILLLLFLIYLLVALYPITKDIIVNIHDEEALVEIIQGYGFRGVLILIGLCMLHPLLMIVPITPFQVLAGLCYGVIKGSLLVEIGYLIGNFIVFTLGRQFKFIIPTRKNKKHKNKTSTFKKYEQMITKAKYPEVLTVALYFIPGVPDGILPVILSKTEISYPKFLISMIIGSVPSVFIFTWCGNAIGKKNYLTAGIIIAVVILLSGLLFYKREKIFDILNKI